MLYYNIYLHFSNSISQQIWTLDLDKSNHDKYILTLLNVYANFVICGNKIDFELKKTFQKYTITVWNL